MLPPHNGIDRIDQAAADRAIDEIAPFIDQRILALADGTAHGRGDKGIGLVTGIKAQRFEGGVLNTSERALQRQLNLEGEIFAGLLNGVRRDLAQRYLRRSPRSLTVIAQSIGYADLSSFTRWFEREFESPPNRWRKKLSLSEPYRLTVEG